MSRATGLRLLDPGIAFGIVLSVLVLSHTTGAMGLEPPTESPIPVESEPALQRKSPITRTAARPASGASQRRFEPGELQRLESLGRITRAVAAQAMAEAPE